MSPPEPKEVTDVHGELGFFFHLPARALGPIFMRGLGPRAVLHTRLEEGRDVKK